MEVTIGDTVNGHDGALGTVERLLIDPRTGKVEHMVVHPGFLQGPDRSIAIESVSGWRRQGLGLIVTTSDLEAKRRVSRATRDAHAGDQKFQGVSCRRPWFALRPARQHWSQCCSPVALPVGSNTECL